MTVKMMEERCAQFGKMNDTVDKWYKWQQEGSNAMNDEAAILAQSIFDYLNGNVEDTDQNYVNALGYAEMLESIISKNR